MTPRVSVITPVYDTDPIVLRECVASVRAQTYTDWEHVLVDDASPGDATAALLEELAASDERLVVRYRSRNGGIVAASNDAIDASSGEILVLLDHDDLLTPDALEQVVSAFDSAADVDYVYSDEDVLEPSGLLVEPFFKPDWSPERFRNQMYTCHISAFRADLVAQVGGFREGYDGSQDWDLVLRVTELARRIVHIARVLYHWRIVATSVLAGEGVKPYAYDAGRRALQDHVDRVGIDADVVEQTPRGYFHIVRRHHDHPLVSIVIPTRCSTGRVWGVDRVMVVESVRSIVERSTWPNYEIVVVVDEPIPRDVVDELGRIAGDRLVIEPYAHEFNFSDKCNRGALRSSGEFLVFLNDDTSVIDPHWIEVLVGFAREPDVGAAGLRLLFEDGRVQHAGHVYLGGNPGHLMFGQFPDSDRNRLALSLDREVAGVTAAALAMRADVFAEAGGFSDVFAGNYNDVDLCCKLRSLGYRVVVSAQASLYHFESVTRDATVSIDELEQLRARWSPELNSDPYYNVNYGSSFDNYPHPLDYPKVFSAAAAGPRARPRRR